jgi:hypothetical protein
LKFLSHADCSGQEDVKTSEQETKSQSEECPAQVVPEEKDLATSALSANQIKMQFFNAKGDDGNASK